MTIYTIGHSNHTIAGLAALLRKHDIACVVDVRSVPYSRYWTQFQKKHLRAGLAEQRIAYCWMGDRLGGKIDCSYDERAAQPEFRAAIADLLALAAEQPTAILCAEKDPRNCHRRKLLTPALAAQNAVVHHILANGDAVADAHLDGPQLALFD